MSSMKETARQFFDACETGGGWEACREYCTPGATFSAQAEALGGVKTLQAYTDWMKGLFTSLPNGSYEVRSFAVDEERGNVIAYGVFRGTNTGPGPAAPTGNSIQSDYVYVMEFVGGRIRHMTTVWNDVAALKQLAWM